jgi:hypothetical protein
MRQHLYQHVHNNACSIYLSESSALTIDSSLLVHYRMNPLLQTTTTHLTRKHKTRADSWHQSIRLLSYSLSLPYNSSTTFTARHIDIFANKKSKSYIKCAFVTLYSPCFVDDSLLPSSRNQTRIAASISAKWRYGNTLASWEIIHGVVMDSLLSLIGNMHAKQR